MYIAVCDDDSREITEITALLEEYRLENNVDLRYRTFRSGTELCSAMGAGEYDMLLLDVLMPGLNGMETAHEIREFDEEVKILFLTSSPEFALESYSVKATDYILKPVSKARLWHVIDALQAEGTDIPEGFPVKSAHGGYGRILFSKLVFVEVIQKRLYFHLSDGTTREVVAPLAEFEARLTERPEFVKVHRSYIVNLWHSSELTPGGIVTYSGETIPISRLLYPQVRKAYMEHLFVEKGCE